MARRRRRQTPSFSYSLRSSSLLACCRLPGLVNTLQVPGAESSVDEEDLESFCILEEEGS